MTELHAAASSGDADRIAVLIEHVLRRRTARPAYGSKFLVLWLRTRTSQTHPASSRRSQVFGPVTSSLSCLSSFGSKTSTGIVRLESFTRRCSASLAATLSCSSHRDSAAV